MTANVCQSDVVSSLDLHLVISDRNILAYLAQFEGEEVQCEKTLEALKVGVIAIQSASPTLDTRVVQAKFAEVESRMKEQMGDFQKTVTDDLRRYFAEQDGVVPRSIDGIFGDDGAMARTFQNFFDPNEGRLSRLMQAQIGPNSNFGKALDPQNKQGVIAVMEARVQELVEAKLDEVLNQFSLDEDGSAMCRLKTMLSEFFGQLNQSLGIKTGAAAEAERGHLKGLVFEEDLYGMFANLSSQLGDHTEFVRGTAGAVGRSKKGDFLATLGDTSGAPGVRIVVEVKNQPMRLKDAIDEMEEAKKNREAACGIFIFARGTEPVEVGDFRRIGEDFYCTVEKADLCEGKPLLCFETAYKVARAIVIAAVGREAAGELDLASIGQHIDALLTWTARVTDMATKAATIQKSGKIIEETAQDLNRELNTRLSDVLRLLRAAPPV
jgi:hypothetical protein